MTIDDRSHGLGRELDKQMAWARTIVKRDPYIGKRHPARLERALQVLDRTQETLDRELSKQRSGKAPQAQSATMSTMKEEALDAIRADLKSKAHLQVTLALLLILARARPEAGRDGRGSETAQQAIVGDKQRPETERDGLMALGERVKQRLELADSRLIEKICAELLWAA